LRTRVSEVPQPLSDEELLLLLRGSWRAGDGDLRDPFYVRALQLGLIQGRRIDAMTANEPATDRGLS